MVKMNRITGGAYLDSIKSYRDNAKYLPSEYDIKDYKAYLQDLIKNPTRALLAMREQDRLGINYVNSERNKKILENDISETKLLSKIAEDNIARLYPTTREVRKYIIDNDRVVLGSVKPSKGYSVFNKIAIMLKKIK